MTARQMFRATGWVLLVAVAVVSLSPAALRPVFAASANLERFIAFAVIGGVLCIGHPKHRVQIALLVLGTAGLLEIAQNLAPGRHGQMLDGTAKAAGGVLGWLIAALLDPRGGANIS